MGLRSLDGRGLVAFSDHMLDGMAVGEFLAWLREMVHV